MGKQAFGHSPAGLLLVVQNASVLRQVPGTLATTQSSSDASIRFAGGRSIRPGGGTSALGLARRLDDEPVGVAALHADVFGQVPFLH
jgi:hypothetical protein